MANKKDKNTNPAETKRPTVKKCKWPNRGACPFKKNIVVCPYETDKDCLDPMPESDPRRKI